MQPLQSLRINLRDFQAHIEKKIGPDKLKRYYYYLKMFLSQKMSKIEFDKLCMRVLGRENLPLHNQFILSLLKNGCQAKIPPPVHEAKSVVQSAKSNLRREDGHKQNDSIVPKQTHNIPIWSNGSLQNGRSGIRDYKLRDGPCSLGSNGKVECVSRQSMDNGELTPCDHQRPVQQLQAEQPKNEWEGSVQRPTEKPRIHSKEKTKVAVVEDGERVEQASHFNFSTSPLLAPIGIPFCTASVGGARKTFPIVNSGNFNSYYDSAVLFNTDTLKKRMEQIAAVQGLGGVSMECANTLNNMLDVYLKRLISSCVELVGARPNPEQKQLLYKQQTQGKVINGLWPTNHIPMRNSSEPGEVMHDLRPHCAISLLDLKIAMELNPQQLGEDWPLLLEKICMQT